MKKQTFLQSILPSAFAVLILCSGRPSPLTITAPFKHGICANVELPAHIKAPEGQLTMVADYAATGDAGVPIFIINKTSSYAIIPNQDGDIYLKLETKDKSGRWVRAQTHRYSDCGNSYGSNSLPPSMHLRILGYRPASGDIATVRYALHSSLSLACAEGTGIILMADVEAARLDQMSVNHVPDTLRDGFDLEWPDKSLTASDLSDRLVLLHQFGGVPALRKGAETKLQEWKANPQPKPEELEAISVFERILELPWADDSSPERLVRHCLSVSSDKGNPAALRALCWRTIGDLAQLTFAKGRTKALSPPSLTEAWFVATKQAARQIADASQLEVLGMRALLNNSSLVDDSLRDTELEPLLKSGNGARVAAYAMARRGLSERLCELALQLSVEHQVTVMAAVACGGRSYDDGASGNWADFHLPLEKSKVEELWKNVMSHAPLQAANALRYIHPYDRGADAFGPIVEQGLRNFWTSEWKKPNQSDYALPSGGYAWRLGLDFLAKANRRGDIPLFRGLLTYGGFEPQEGSKSGLGGKSIPYRVRRYGVREAAVCALRSMHVQVPSDIILQADVSDPDHIVVKKVGDEE